MMDSMRKAIESVECTYADARYHMRRSLKISVARGELEEVVSSEISGVGVRVLKNGSWGFACVNSVSEADLVETARSAERIAELSSKARRSRVEGLAEARFANGIFRLSVNGPLDDVPIEDKMKVVLETEKRIRQVSPDIASAKCSYYELLDHKMFINTEGGWFESHNSKPEFRTAAVCMSGSESVIGMDAVGITGGWNDLFSMRDHLEIGESAASKALALLSASHLKGGRETVVLDPSLVGIISHEAIGHTVEADIVQSGSAAKGMLGKKVTSEMVTMLDSGNSEHSAGAAGTISVDDEGIRTGRTELIRKGILVGYLHDRESAAVFGAEPTGNARAFEHSDEPIIRMRNTYIEPGDWKLDELISDTKHGYLVRGALNGEADVNAEFMFALQEAQEIENGELGRLYRGVTISGNAFEVLSAVDAITSDFKWDMGSGYCGKGQLAKVDGGGGFMRCKALLGGRINE